MKLITSFDFPFASPVLNQLICRETVVVICSYVSTSVLNCLNNYFLWIFVLKWF